MTDLNLAELDRLEQHKGDSDVAGENAAWEALSQLRPLLDLVKEMGEALEPLLQSFDPSISEILAANAAHAKYQRAKGD